MITQNAQETQAEYDKLLEERTAFEQAGLTAKVGEWDYKIKSLEVSQKYEKIDLKHIAESFGIEGLNRSLAERKNKLKAEAKEICGDLLKSKRVSESKMYDFIDKTAFRYDNNPELKEEILRLLVPKLSGTALKIFQTMFKIKDMENTGNKIAFIKIEKVDKYTQNDNPPMSELLKVVQANTQGLFIALYIAYPMIAYEKQVDPIILGTIQNPNESYEKLSNWNNEITIDMLDFLNIGDMYKVAEWI